MPKILSAKEKVMNHLDRMVIQEKDKWDAGLNNQYLEMDTIVNDLKASYEMNKRYSEENYNLMKRNEWLELQLKNNILRNEILEIIDNYMNKYKFTQDIKLYFDCIQVLKETLKGGK